MGAGEGRWPVTSAIIESRELILHFKTAGFRDFDSSLCSSEPLSRRVVYFSVSVVGWVIEVGLHLALLMVSSFFEARVSLQWIQKFLGHKRLNSTMVYARVHDRTVAEDYYAAMERIEQRLDVGTPPEQDHAETPVNGRERAQLLELAARLAKPELGVESRLNLVEQVRQVLNHSAPPDEEE